jgi:hypothetical protein
VPGPSDVLERLTELNEQLTSAYLELAELQCAEREGKLETWVQLNSQGGETIASTDRKTDHSVLPLTQDIYKLKAEIQAWQEERDHLRFLVDMTLKHNK